MDGVEVQQVLAVPEVQGEEGAGRREKRVGKRAWGPTVRADHRQVRGSKRRQGMGLWGPHEGQGGKALSGCLPDSFIFPALPHIVCHPSPQNPPPPPCKRAPPHAVVEVRRADPRQVVTALLQRAAEHCLQVSERPALRIENGGHGDRQLVAAAWRFPRQFVCDCLGVSSP